MIKDEEYLNLFLETLLKDRDCLVALHGLYLQPSKKSVLCTEKINEYIKYIFSKDRTNYINHILENYFFITSSKLLFIANSWEISKHDELTTCFRLFFEYKTIDPSKSLLNLNLFNELLYEKVCNILNVTHPKQCTYGENLNSNRIESFLPVTNRCFRKINEERNQQTDAHLYSKNGKIRTRIDHKKLNNLIKHQENALNEICEFDFQLYL